MAVLVSTLVIAAPLVRLQLFKHLKNGCPQSCAQLLAAVGFSKWRHVDKGRVAVPQVQRGVVDVVTQIPARSPEDRSEVMYGLFYHVPV